MFAYVCVGVNRWKSVEVQEEPDFLEKSFEVSRLRVCWLKSVGTFRNRLLRFNHGEQVEKGTFDEGEKKRPNYFLHLFPPSVLSVTTKRKIRPK